MAILNWLSFISLITLITVIGYRGRRQAANAQHYFVSDKRTSLFALIATLVMTDLNTSTLVGFGSMGFRYGTSALGISCVFLFGLLFYALSVAKKWKAFDGVSVTTFFSQRYNPAIGYIAAAILLTAMIGFSANYVKSLTLIFQPLFPDMPQWLLSGLFCLLMAIITLRGGLPTVIKIDVISFILTLVILPLITLMSLLYYGELNTASLAETGRAHFPFRSIVALVLITMFTHILAPWYGQKIFAAQSQRVAFQAVAITAVVLALLDALIILAALFLSQNAPKDLQPAQAIPFLVHHHFPLILKGLAYGLLFFIATTTLAALWNTIASVIMGHHHKRLAHTRAYTGMLITAAVSLISYILANSFIDHIFEKMVLMNIPISALAFSLLGGFYWRRVSPSAALCSIIIGLAGGLGCYVWFGVPDYMWYWGAYAIPASFIAGILVTLLNRQT